MPRLPYNAPFTARARGLVAPAVFALKTGTVLLYYRRQFSISTLAREIWWLIPSEMACVKILYSEPGLFVEERLQTVRIKRIACAHWSCKLYYKVAESMGLTCITQLRP